MRKRERKNKQNIEHRGNTRDLVRTYQLEMDVVHKIPPTYYRSDGEVLERSEKHNIRKG